MVKTKEPKKCSDKCCGWEKETKKVANELHKIGEEVKNMVERAKTKYDEADPKTKKALIAGVAGAAALIAGAIGYKKMKGKK